MKNKKAGTFGIITAAAVALILFYIFVGPIIKDIIVDKQIAFAGGKTEEITIDCDGDNVIGFKDHCPCVALQKELKSEETCFTPDPKSEDICPKLCKK